MDMRLPTPATSLLIRIFNMFRRCLVSVSAMCFLVESQLCPIDALSTDAERAIPRLRCAGSETATKAEMEDKKEYNADLKRLFGQ